ncbi:MFS transporter [Mesorhizobium sp. WSM4312]|uniref:MFS transporter n=1 Tax=unclassified Mesorhizobium TaxID=325217 RepID=UPI000BB06B6A|nr:MULTISPECIES: MFS transporter [unclassified Mesorhizobium]PBB65624.1 MFS transporter [Mesorhizobium sp. WSM4312]TRC70783.1 MFS transporter [Mesorhizobium sp. WSM4315]TRC77875.1 MFS transporter [Mesorhizobium sp. WSM4307]TRC80659.1 MFS transporter [Mesorhizobium sp. WSM4310]
MAATNPVGIGAGRRWSMLAVICAGAFLPMTAWFSATAIAPQLTQVWGLSPAQGAWITGAVQVGFAVGALASSIAGLLDIVSLRKVIGISALITAIANLCLLVTPSVGLLLLARFATGVALAGVYPPALKLVSTWFRRGRGVALGALLAALTLGSAFPHLLSAFATDVSWQDVIIATSLAALAGAILILCLGSEGPYPFAKSTFDRRHIRAVLQNRPLALANLGYLGHMWELYAMWGWMLAYIRAGSPGLGTDGPRMASLLAFLVVASGGIGSILGGIVADRIGRTATAAMMMTLSGFCALTIGLAFDGPLWLFIAIAILWGMTVIGDSAQFSAMTTELSDPRYVGTALSLQLSVGIALTFVSIHLTSSVAEVFGWRWSFLILAPGPLLGVVAMVALRRMPAARLIAHGLM